MPTINYRLNDKVVPVEIPEGIVDPTEQDDWVTNVYYPYYDAGLANASEDSSHPFSGLPDWAARGFYRLGQTANIAQVQLGLDNEENAAQDIADYQRHLSKVPYDEEVLETLIKIEDALSVGDFWDAVSTVDGLETILTVAGESLAQYAPALATTVATGIATAGTAYPAVMIGAVAGLGSAATEFGSATIEAMSDYLATQGTDISNNKAVAEALSNEEKMAEFEQFALKRGLPIGIVDALSVGLAGKLTLAVKGMERGGRAAKYAAFGAEALGIQPTLGGLGEYAAQKVAGQEFSLGDIGLEMFAEIPGGTAEIGVGLLVDQKRNQLAEQEKERGELVREAHMEMLRQASRADEYNIVTDDLVNESINPETGVADSVGYEERIIKYGGERPKAGERAIDKSGIKNIFNLKNPKSVNVVTKHLLDKKIIKKRKGSTEFNWTKEAEQKYDSIVPIEIGDTVQWTTSEGVDQLFTPKKVLDIQETKWGPHALLEGEVGYAPVEQLSRWVLSPEEFARAQEKEQKFRPPPEPEVTEDIVIEEEVIPDPLQPSEEIVVEQDNLKQEVNDARTEAQTLETQRETLDPNDPAFPEINQRIMEANNRVMNAELSLASSLNKNRPPNIPPPIDPVDETVSEQDNMYNVPSTFVNFLDEATVKDPPPVKERLKDFKLRREGRTIPVLDEFKTNTAEILAQQKINIDESPADEFNSMKEMDKVQERFKDVLTYLNRMSIRKQSTANERERKALRENLKKRAKEMNAPELVIGMMQYAYKVYHPQRLGELFSGLKPIAFLSMSRREFRELYQQKPFLLMKDFLENTDTEDQKNIGFAYLLLDAFFGPRKTSPLNETSFNIDAEGNLSFIIPNTPPNIINEEGEIEGPSVDQELYELQLKEMGGFKPGDEITLTATQWDKLKTVNAALKTSYSTYVRAFARFLLQNAPLAPGIEQNFYDTPDTLQQKIIESVLQYYSKLAKLNPEQTEKFRKRFTSARQEWITTLIEEIKPSIPKEDKDSRVLMDRIIAQTNIIKMINEYKRTLRDHPFYIPRLRYGDYYFTIYDKQTQKIVGYYTSPPVAFDEILGKSKQEKRLNTKRSEILKSFPSSRFTVSSVKPRSGEKAKNYLDQRDLTLLERLLLTMAHSNDAERKEIITDIMKQAKESITQKGFGKMLSQRSPDLVLGYFDPEDAPTYVSIQASNYIRSSADSSSNLEFYNPIETVLQTLRDGYGEAGDEDYIKAQPELYQLAQKTIDSINSPNEPGSLFKSIAFHYALGGNFSSAFVNLTQTFVTTIPMLNTIAGLKGGSATKEVMRGLNDARKLFKFSGDRLSSYGFRFDQEQKPKEYSFLTNDEYAYLRNLYNEGVIQAIVNLDLGAKYQQQLGQVLDKGGVGPQVADSMAKVMDASAFMFGAVEQINRIATALAAYRLAVKSEKNLKNFEKYSKFTVFADQKMTPELAGKMAVYQTQFLIGKENRPELFRSGIMNVGTQFLSFVMQYATMYYRTLQMFKVEPRMAATMMGGLVLSMLFFGGAMGLPWMENLRQLLSKLSQAMRWDGGEFDLEYGLRQALIDSELPLISHPEVVEMLTRGVASRIMGMDISRRVGVGEVIPFSVMQGDLMAATGPFGSLMADVFINMNQAIKDDNYARLITSVLPLAPRYFVEGIYEGLADKPISTSQGRVLLPSEDITAVDRLKQIAGFTPGEVAKARRQKQVAQYLGRKMRPLQDEYYSKLARLYEQRRESTNESERKEISTEIKEIRDEIRQRNREAREEKRPEDIITITPRSLRERRLTERRGQVDRIKKKAIRRVRSVLPKRLEELSR